ncbi:hypothetical protein F4775DRAFT_261532 [Biscogniauxia sp. FL1348]|nr:hypothetical protein F4775DRAFT_261532 [Biscogniauxia sp. FL1348]
MTRALFSRSLEPPRLAHHIRRQITPQSLGLQFSTSQRHGQKPDYKARPAWAGPEVEACSKVWETCKKHKIKMWTDLRGLKGVKLPGNICKLNVATSRSHCFDIKSMKYLDKFEHPFTQSVLDLYIAQTDKPLWYNAWAASGASGASPFPCSKAAKRMTHALRDALAACGYDRDGRRVVTDSTTDRAGDVNIKELYGTLKVGCMDAKAVLRTKFVDLLEMGKVIIRCVEKELGRDHMGNHIQGRPPRTPSRAPSRAPSQAGYGYKPKSNPKPAGPWKQTQNSSNNNNSNNKYAEKQIIRFKAI